jgi:hypothetical protein
MGCSFRNIEAMFAPFEIRLIEVLDFKWMQHSCRNRDGLRVLLSGEQLRIAGIGINNVSSRPQPSLARKQGEKARRAAARSLHQVLAMCAAPSCSREQFGARESF